MKKSILIIAAVFFSISSIFAQVTVIKYVDSMTDDVFYVTSQNPVFYTTPAKTVGFKLSVYISDNNGQAEVSAISVTHAGLGSCNEKDEIIILFEDGTKITKKTISKFGCKGTATFLVDSEDKKNLEAKTISKIRVTNGYNFESATVTPATPIQKNYFKEVYQFITIGEYKTETI